MKKLGSILLTRLVPALVIGGSLAACTVTGHGYIRTPGVYVEPAVVYEEPPPPRRVYMAPRPGFIWIEGRWNWSGGRWVWMDGRYEHARADSDWRPGYWERRNNGHVWVEGRWEAHGHVHGNGNTYDRRDNGRRDRGKVRDHTH